MSKQVIFLPTNTQVPLHSKFPLRQPSIVLSVPHILSSNLPLASTQVVPHAETLTVQPNRSFFNVNATKVFIVIEYMRFLGSIIT